MKTRIHVVQGDITKLAVDVIVNAANPSLMEAAASMGPFIAQRVRLCWMPV